MFRGVLQACHAHGAWEILTVELTSLSLLPACLPCCSGCRQVDFVKLLMDKLRYLHTKYMDTPLAARFPRPTFKVGVWPAAAGQADMLG